MKLISKRTFFVMVHVYLKMIEVLMQLLASIEIDDFFFICKKAMNWNKNGILITLNNSKNILCHVG